MAYVNNLILGTTLRCFGRVTIIGFLVGSTDAAGGRVGDCAHSRARCSAVMDARSCSYDRVLLSAIASDGDVQHLDRVAAQAEQDLAVAIVYASRRDELVHDSATVRALLKSLPRNGLELDCYRRLLDTRDVDEVSALSTATDVWLERVSESVRNTGEGVDSYVRFAALVDGFLAEDVGDWLSAIARAHPGAVDTAIAKLPEQSRARMREWVHALGDERWNGAEDQP